MQGYKGRALLQGEADKGAIMRNVGYKITPKGPWEPVNALSTEPAPQKRFDLQHDAKHANRNTGGRTKESKH